MKPNLQRIAAWLMVTLLVLNCVPAYAITQVEYSSNTFSASQVEGSNIATISSSNGTYTVPVYYYDTTTKRVTHKSDTNLTVNAPTRYDSGTGAEVDLPTVTITSDL